LPGGVLPKSAPLVNSHFAVEFYCSKVFMAALPYIQLYIADYLADTMHLSATEHGAYLLLIMNYWQTGKPLLNDDDILSKITRTDKDEWDAIKDIIKKFFKKNGKHLVHPRIENDLKKVLDKSNKASMAGQISAEHRFNKRSTNVERTLIYTDTDTETETNTDTKTDTGEEEKPLVSDKIPPASAIKKETSPSYNKDLAICLLSKLDKYHYGLSKDISREKLSEADQLLLDVTTKNIRNMVDNKTSFSDAVLLAMETLNGSCWHAENGYVSVYWLLDVENEGKKAIIRLRNWLEKARKKKPPGAKSGGWQDNVKKYMEKYGVKNDR